MTQSKFTIPKTLILFLLFASCINAETPTLSFDGIDDYVDLGINSGDNVRTIELWFQLEEEITPELGNFVSLIMRYSTPQNRDNFSLSFQPSSLINPGTLRFNMTVVVGEEYDVFSDSDSWEANRWYHVAAVVHPVLGMSIYIDGKKQSSTNSFSEASAANDFTTTIGSWGSRLDLDRFFKGTVDDLRFSNEAIYSEDFIPACPTLQPLSSTIGLWNFNENSGNLALDSSQGMNDAEIVGPTRSENFICETSNTDNTFSETSIMIYPNPANDILTISSTQPRNNSLIIYNSLGQKMITKMINNNKESIDISELDAGNYMWIIKGDKQNEMGKFIVLQN